MSYLFWEGVLYLAIGIICEIPIRVYQNIQLENNEISKLDVVPDGLVTCFWPLFVLGVVFNFFIGKINKFIWDLLLKIRR